jgi:putative heme-binding domain-containing protein
MRLVVEEVKAEALKGLTENELNSVEDLLIAPTANGALPAAGLTRPVVREWTMTEALSLLENKLTKRNFDHGKEMFAAALCFKCHRFNGDGGATGPDLTALSGRFGARDILESIIDPDKVVSDQYAGVNVLTISGHTISGRIVNFKNNSIVINTDMLDPTASETLSRSEIDEIHPSTVSMMPKGLLNTLNEDELLDLFAFLLSQGDRHHSMFER